MSALQTDLYQLTMAAGYFHRGLAHTMATCELFVRRLPKPRRYLVACGIEQGLEFLAGLQFSEDEIEYLRQVPGLRDAMTPDFVEYLRSVRFTGDVWSVPEGTVMFAGEPFMRVRAPIIEAQLAETFLLSTVNHGTMIASKAARVVHAAGGRAVMEFGTRRVHADAAVDVARAAYLVGAVGTSNVEAGHRFGVPVLGTAAHMWTMTHDSEEEAFANYVNTFPNASILLIDTYDTVRGAERAARIARDKLKGVRLDSGDLGELSRAVREVLDREGCAHAKIVASGDLNEYKIKALLASGAPIDLFGVGTELAASKDAPALGGVYKVVEYERDGKKVPIAKFAEGKATYPGPHQVYRAYDESGCPVNDVLSLADESPIDGREALLSPRIEGGARIGLPESVLSMRERAMKQLDSLSSSMHGLEPSDAAYPVTPSAALMDLVSEVKARTVD